MRSTQGGEITVYGLTETAWQVSDISKNTDSISKLLIEKHRHDYRLKHPQRRQDKKPIAKSKDPHAILGPGKRNNEREIVEEKEETASGQPCKRKRLTEVFKSTHTFSSKDTLV